jgi:hypothetical protein
MCRFVVDAGEPKAGKAIYCGAETGGAREMWCSGHRGIVYRPFGEKQRTRVRRKMSLTLLRLAR